MTQIWRQPVDMAPFAPVIDQTIVGHMGIEFTEFGPDYICATLPVDRRTIQPMGILHGGASVVLAETLGSVASFLALDSDHFQWDFKSPPTTQAGAQRKSHGHGPAGALRPHHPCLGYHHQKRGG